MDDRRLLALLRKGDQATWRSTFDALYSIALSGANHYKHILSSGEIEEVASEAVIAAIRHVKKAQTFDEVKILTFRIAKNQAISAVRKHLAQKRNSGNTESIESLINCDFLEQSPKELWELKELVGAFLDDLDDKFRNLIEDFALNGLSYKELSQKYNLPMGTVGVQISRTIGKLRKTIEKNPRVAREILLYLE